MNSKESYFLQGDGLYPTHSPYLFWGSDKGEWSGMGHTYVSHYTTLLSICWLGAERVLLAKCHLCYTTILGTYKDDLGVLFILDNFGISLGTPSRFPGVTMLSLPLFFIHVVTLWILPSTWLHFGNLQPQDFRLFDVLLTLSHPSNSHIHLLPLYLLFNPTKTSSSFSSPSLSPLVNVIAFFFFFLSILNRKSGSPLSCSRESLYLNSGL